MYPMSPAAGARGGLAGLRERSWAGAPLAHDARSRNPRRGERAEACHAARPGSTPPHTGCLLSRVVLDFVSRTCPFFFPLVRVHFFPSRPREFTRCPKLRFAGPVGRKPKCKTARPRQPPPFKESRPPRGSNIRLATARHGRRRRQARRTPQERLARRAAVPHRAEEPLALARPAREAPALPPRAVPPHLALRAVRARRRHRHRSSAAPMAQGSPTRAG